MLKRNDQEHHGFAMKSILSETSGIKILFIIFLFATLIGLFNTNYFYLTELASGERIPLKYPLIHELTGTYTIFLLLPVLFWIFNKFPLTRKNLLRRLPIYLLLSFGFGVCHTLLMFASRILVYRLVGLGKYDYGNLGYRFFQEYSHQLFTFWIIWGVVFVIRSIKAHQAQKLRTAQLEKQLAKAHLQTLQMQVNPHFLFNTLNMISSTMYEDVNRADTMMAHLSDILRITLNRANREVYPLEEELDLVRDYLDIMKARFQDKLVVEMDIDPDTLPAQVPGFILQPLIENSIKFTMEAGKNIRIQITSEKRGERIRLIIRDNGRGLRGEEKRLGGGGVGLSNTAERLERTYGDDHLFQLMNIEDGGLQVLVEVPLRISAKEN
jgi:signal transduction histidine kinase